MNILIDYLASNTGGGKTVAQNQIKCLLEQDHKNYYYCLIENNNEILETEYINCKIINVNCNSIFNRFIFQLFTIPKIINKFKIDILFCPNNYTLYFKNRAKVIVMYQDANLFYPRFLGKNCKIKIKYIILRFITKLSYRIADINIFTSKFMKGKDRRGILNNLGVTINFIPETYNSIKKNYDLSIVVSNFSYHKNLNNLFKTLNNYKLKYKKELSLVIIGGDQNTKRINRFKKYADINELSKVNFTGYVDKDIVFSFLNKSKLYISPSFLESFSLTPFEAIQCNVPIILSDIQVYKELCGNYNIYFNPNNPENIADKIHDVFENYVYYYNLIPKIKKYASKFTWENHAKKLIEIFKSLKGN